MNVFAKAAAITAGLLGTAAVSAVLVLPAHGGAAAGSVPRSGRPH